MFIQRVFVWLRLFRIGFISVVRFEVAHAFVSANGTGFVSLLPFARCGVAKEDGCGFGATYYPKPQVFRLRACGATLRMTKLVDEA